MQHRGKKPQFFSYMLLKKDWIDVLPQALGLTRVSQQAQVCSLKQEVLHAEMFPVGHSISSASVGSCSEPRASPKAVYFLPFCINSELLFLLPQHSHATTPNTVVFAENHSCAKSVTVFIF